MTTTTTTTTRGRRAQPDSWTTTAIKSGVIAISILATACGANEGILKSGKETPSTSGPSGPATTVERDVEDMRTADFAFIYVLRRRDGGQIDAEDKAVIRAQTYEANRRIASDDGRSFVIGSNRQISADKMASINARFAVDDLSPPPPAESANAVNANSNK